MSSADGRTKELRSLGRVTTNELLRGIVAARRPTERELALGRALRNARISAGFRQDDVAERIGCSQPTIARMEKGTKRLAEPELTALLDLYKPDNRAEIERLAGPTDDGGLTLHPDFEALLRVEEHAASVRRFTSERIPMQLQCERYALKQYDLTDTSFPPTEVIRLRNRRIQVLTRKDGPSIDVVMSFSALLRMPGGQADLVGEQAQHLLDQLDSAPRLTVRLLMFDANIPYIDSDFTLVTRRDRLDAVLYVPFGRDGHKIAEKKKIKERESYWKLAQDAALSIEETRVVLGEVAAGRYTAMGRRHSHRHVK